MLKLTPTLNAFFSIIYVRNNVCFLHGTATCMYVLKVSDKFSIVYSGPEMRGGEIIVTL